MPDVSTHSSTEASDVQDSVTQDQNLSQDSLPKGYAAMVALVLALPALGTCWAFWNTWHHGLSWRAPVCFVIMYLISGWGVTVGFHRLLTHHSFEAPRWLRALFMIAGATSLQGSPITWIATHREHHAHADQPRDPHTPLQSFWHAHLGWMFAHQANTNRYARDLLADPLMVAIDKIWWICTLLGLVVPWAIGGLEGLLWGGFVRIFVVHHATWSVNSVCHRFGSRDHPTRDHSRNNLLIALVALGEGWHNNHHTHPRAAFVGWRWYQIDLSGLLIRTLARVGLITNVRQPR